jgi:hypothetical protein
MRLSVKGAPWEKISTPLQAAINIVPETIYRETVYVGGTTMTVAHNAGVRPDRIIFEPLGTNTYYATEDQRKQWDEKVVVFTASGTGQYVIVNLETY